MAKKTKESDVILNFRMNGEVAYSKSIKQINDDMRVANLEYKNQISSMDKNASATEKLTAAKQKLEKQVAIMTAKTEGLREEYQKSVQETGQYSEKSQKLYEMLLKSETSENNLRKALEKTNDALEAQGNTSISTAEKLKKIEAAGKSIEKAGKGLSVGVTTPLIGIAAAGTKVATDLNNSQKQIQAAFNLTAQEAENVNNAVENVFASGMVESVDESKEAVISLINQFPKLKTASADTIQGMTEKALSLEKAYGSDFEETLRGANSLMDAYGISGEKAMDLITVASQGGLDKTHELGDNLAEYATLFEQSGYSAEEMFTILKAGLDGGAYNLDKVNDLVKEFGIRLSDGSIEKAVEDMGGGFQQVFKEVKNGEITAGQAFPRMVAEINKLGSEQEKAAAISTIFGSLGEDAGIKVITAMGQANEATKEFKNSLENSKDAAENFKNGIEETVTYQQAMNSLMIAASEVGEVFAPYLQKAAEALKSFAEWFRSLDDNTKNMIVTIGGVIAAVGPILVALGSVFGAVSKIANAVKLVQTAFTVLTTFLAANPFVFVIAGIAALVAGFIWAYNNVEWFRNGVNASFTFIKDVIIGAFSAVWENLKGTFTGILDFIKAQIENMKLIFNGIIDFFTGVFTGNWEQAWNGIINVFKGIFGSILEFAKAPINGMIKLINDFITLANKVQIDKDVPLIGGIGINIPKIPYLAKGGSLIDGQAIVGEAGPELLSVNRGKTTVTPLSDREKREGIGGKGKQTTVNQTITIGNVDANNPSELDKLNRKLAKASRMAGAF